MRTLGLVFGALAPPLAEQLTAAGVPSENVPDMEHHQKDADAIARLSIRGLMSDAEKDRARNRLLKAIIRDLEDHVRRLKEESHAEH